MAATVIDWPGIEKWMMLTEDFGAASRHFNVKEDSIRKRARRHAWPLPSVVAAKAAELRIAGTVQRAQNGALIEGAAKNIAERGEEHAQMVFTKANAALRDMKKFPVKNARDVEVLDRVARRSAGMGNDDEGVKISLIALNESINAHADDSDVIEGEIVSVPSEPLALPEQNAGA